MRRASATGPRTCSTSGARSPTSTTDKGTALQYNSTEVGAAKPLLHDFLDPKLKSMHPRHKKFRANRSMRDVEPSVNLWLRTMDNVEIEQEDQP